MALSDPFDNTPPTPIAIGTTWDNGSPVASTPTLAAGHDNTSPDAISVTSNYVLATRGSTANVNLAATLQGVAMDGEPCTIGDTVLLKNQTNAAQNGVYLVNAGVATRHTPVDQASEFEGGLIVEIGVGAVNAGKKFVLMGQPPIILGTTPLFFTEDAATPRPV